ncbi:AAA family ATPase [Rhodopirellula sp. JC740]|uniref:AAA family ATPase n=1 Tax=Rhodopirellula halodulae TaxID=2894198 RepID=A0ABS8NNP8_9BACT|nr:AAA family ATPase [Rhodopirellula sp. JC740]MCC9645198.1 AAA family ATPase [Rhodopirellula sp. JC740]
MPGPAKIVSVWTILRLNSLGHSVDITALSFCNFRCFGTDPVTIQIQDITALIGENGAGKSAALIGLARMFGLTKELRTVRADDFHLPIGKSRSDSETESLSMWIEARIEFDELDSDHDSSAVPEHFRQMLVDDTGGKPYCRIRLDATWQKGNLPEGEVDQSLVWIMCPTELTEPVKEEDCKPLTSYERQRIHVHYIPGARDPSRHVRVSSQSLLKRLLDAANWSEELSESVDSSMDDVVNTFDEEAAIVELQETLNASWRSLYNRSRFKEVSLQLETRSVQDFVSSFIAEMRTESGDELVPVDRLSDGLRSLLYFAIVQSAFAIEQVALDDSIEESNFDLKTLDPPLLTIFAVEEPETHLAPHLLGRVLKMFRTLVDQPRAQAVFTSHSPSVLMRIEPEEVRHLRLNSESAVTVVSQIELPEEASDADKFVRQAVRAYPELYFARLVILGEGDSEEVVLGRLLEANRLPSDPNVISVVPLGGRHVNHLWRLLNSLSIPHLTLLDFDCERKSGGWGRVHYACQQLMDAGVAREQILLVEKGTENQHVMDDAEFEALAESEIVGDVIVGWVNKLEEFDVFLSSPLDLDYSMLRAFGDEYRGTADGKPQSFSDDEQKKRRQIKSLFKAVFGKSNVANADRLEKHIDDLRWYRYLFLHRSKPATHMAALADIDDGTLLESCPLELQRLMDAIREKVSNG